VKIVTFECEVITPMFCYGADQTSPEIRAASIKGAMRFWWRALHPNLNIDKLRKKETEIFGGAGDGEAQRSSFNLKVSKMQWDSKHIYRPVPHKNNGNAFPQPAFKIGQTFKVKIGSKNIMPFKLFQLFSIIGGIGKRSRRGFGSFRIIAIDNTEFKEEVNVQYIEKLAKSINDLFNFNSKRKTLYPYLINVHAGQTFGNSDGLLKRIGQASHIHNSNCTGFADRQSRFSSPLYATVIKTKQNSCLIILSELFCAPEKCDEKFCNHGKRIEFIKEVLL